MEPLGNTVEAVLDGLLPKVGDPVQVRATPTLWISGTVEDAFISPVTRSPVVVVDGMGYYPEDWRRAA